MFYSKIVQEALSRSWSSGFVNENLNNTPPEDQDTLISRLIHDLFGAEILKTHSRHGWHYYNRIEGKRYDFTRPSISGPNDVPKFEDIQTTPEEISSFPDDSDYSIFMIQFIRAYEESLGLTQHNMGCAS
jgi:hypothetical protein